MTNYEQCITSRKFLINTIQNMSRIDTDILKLIDWDAWFESENPEPCFKNSIQGQYSPSSNHTSWYDCIIIDQNKTILDKPAALIWTLAADHVPILVLKENLRYG